MSGVTNSLSKIITDELFSEGLLSLGKQDEVNVNAEKLRYHIELKLEKYKNPQIIYQYDFKRTFFISVLVGIIVWFIR